jgi:hypothetical protein
MATLLVKQQTIWDELEEDRRRTPTSMIFHYADKRGLSGISKYGKLWLNDFTRMYDTSEIEYGFDIGMQILREAYENGPKTGRLKRFMRGTEAIAKRGLPKYFLGYILSLTPLGDELPQWEIYGERARGYCLVFNGRRNRILITV